MTNGLWPKDSEDLAFLQGAATVLIAQLFGLLVWWFL